jgi:ribosomal protein S18 acetylase RimI-like enzyme
MHHQRARSVPLAMEPKTRAGWGVRNHREKRELVITGCAHGILVYANGEPVGWCQFGPRDELPRMDGSPRYQRLGLENGGGKMWRVTCFVVDKQYRRRGVAGMGLRAALESISKRGGGLVEAYPVSKTDQGVNYIYCGTVGMFEKAGFKTVTPLASGRTSTVVMRKSIWVAGSHVCCPRGPKSRCFSQEFIDRQASGLWRSRWQKASVDSLR